MDLLARARRAGLDCAVHAIGDQAVAIALDAFTTSGARGSIEHAQLIGPRDPDRFASLGLVASIQPQHALDDRDVADELWADRTDRAFAYRTLWSAGVRLALGSDAPVAPLDPWSTLSAAEHRTRAHLPPWHPEQCLPREVAWAASVRGRVAPGEPADLILLDQDPLRAEDIAAVRPVATMVAGRFVAGPCCQS